MLAYFGTENRIFEICPSRSFVARKYTTVIALPSTSTSGQTKSFDQRFSYCFVIDIFYVHDNDDNDATGLV